MKSANDQNREILERGVEEIISRENLEKKLASGQVLRVKFGTDPTSPNIHLGRSIPLLKLRDFQKAGHQIVLIIGDFTGVIGDTSDKDSERPMLSREQVEKNMENYVQQAGKILDIEKCEIHYNSQWLDKLNYREICEQTNLFSLADFISRENIKKRLDAGKRISLRELLYPMMQGYDSVMVKADIEIGGSDQRFNLLAGRELQRHYGQEAQDIIMGPIIEGLDGRKMSSSWGNTINLLDDANEMYGKIMSLKDELIIKYLKLASRLDLEEIASYEKDLAGGRNPRDIKMILAKEIVSFYHSSEEALKAEEYFINTFSKKETPKEIERFHPKSYLIIDILSESGLAPSKSEARRLVESGGIKVNEEVINDLKFQLQVGDTLQKGKRFFLKID